MDGLTRVIILIVLLILAAFFSMTECSFSYCNRIKMKVEADDNNKHAKRVLKYLDDFDRYLVVNLICSNIVILLFSVLSTVLFVNIVHDVNPEANADSIGALISTIVSTLIVFFIGEIIPKGIGKTFPNQISKFCVYPIMFFDIILYPISFVFAKLVILIKKIFKAPENDQDIDEEDFQDIVVDIEDKGLIEEQESDIIQSAIEFDETRVRQVMCPRENIVALDINEDKPRDALIDYILDNPFSRFPVYDGDIDHIVGILHTQKLLKVLMTGQEYDKKALLMEPIFVSPNVHLDTLFDEFQKKRTHIAIVTDKDGKTIGLVTMEDLLEELVGDIDEELEVKGGDADD